MEMDDTSAVQLGPSDPPGRCVMCGYTPSEIEAFGELEALCSDCKDSFLEYMYENSTEDIALDSVFMEDSDASVNVDSFLDNTIPADPEFQSFVHDDTYIDSRSSGPNQWNSDNDDQDGNEFEDVEDDENTIGTLVGRIQLHRSLATNGRNIPDDWLNEILSGEGDIRNRDRRRVHVPNIFEETSRYVGNSGDYLDTRGFEELLERLADTDISLVGPPPASVSFVKNLKPVVVDDTEGLVCVICKEVASVGTIVNRLPCHHVYHPWCIIQWLNARNTCPLCRYEVPTDDKDYERRRGGSREAQVQEVEGEDGSSEEEEGGADDSGGGRWWFVAAPIVSMVGIGLVLWFGGRVFGGSWSSWVTQRDNRSGRRWWCLL